jgi:predicted amidohydrolase YtcJ
MDGNVPIYADAVVQREGRIIYVGTKGAAIKEFGGKADEIDLQGKTMLPGFIDPHSHFINSLSLANQANCSAPPFGPGKDPESIVKTLLQFKTQRNIGDGEMLMGYGYDDTQMAQENLLDRDHLDEAFPKNPVIVMHVSLHGAVLNSMALKQFGVSEKTETPLGGVIVRKLGTNEPYGLIMETAFLPIFLNLPKPTAEQIKEQIKAGQIIFAKAGLTTAQEGASRLADITILQNAADNGELFIDIIAYPLITEFDSIMKRYHPSDFGKYKNHLKLGGIKILIDGSPQGRTALFTTPYLTGGPSGEKDWRGEPTFPQNVVNEMLKKVYDSGIQSIFHANGDAAIDMCIKAHEYASGDDFSKDRRTTVIHSQFVRPDQLDIYVKEGLLASFYTEHTYFFANAHIRNRGEKQTSFISPMKTAINKGVRCTNHTDFNVVPIDQMLVVWSAVNRISRDGKVIGPSERITAYQALQAITSWSAYQYFDENTKGKIKEGLLADFVILDKNPLKVDPETIRDIKVLETIKEGKIIYQTAS